MEKGKSHTGSPELLQAPLSKFLACIEMIYFLLLTQLGGHTFGVKLPYISIVFQNALNWFKLIPNMLATSQMVIFLFSGTSSFTKSVLLLGWCPEHLVFLAAIILLLNLEHLKSLCSSHYLISKNYPQYFKSFCSIFSSPFKAKFYEDTVFFEVCHFWHMWNITCGTTHPST